MRRSGQSGSATIAVLVIGSVLSIIGIATVSLVAAHMSVARRIDQIASRETKMLEAVQRVIVDLARDPTPEADSPVDPIWTATNGSEGSIHVTDISSAINPNWVRPTFLSRSGLEDRLLTTGRTAEELSQYRIDNGIGVDVVVRYEDFFAPATIEEYLTGYGFFNINVTHEAVLRDLYELRTGSSGAASLFLSDVQSALEEGTLWNDGDLRSLFGVNYDRVYPVINAAAAFNVHYLHEEILRAIVSFPYGGKPIPDAATAVDVIRAERELGEITPERLQTILTVESDAQRRIFSYLGTTTWFWRIGVEIGEVPNTAVGFAIVMRVPSPEPPIGVEIQPPVFRVVEWQLTPADLPIR